MESYFIEPKKPLNEVNEISETLHIRKLLDRIIEDELIIKRMLGFEDKEPLYLLSIKINNGDRHGYGKGVSILTL